MTAKSSLSLGNSPLSTQRQLQRVPGSRFPTFQPREYFKRAQELTAFVHISGKTLTNIKKRAIELITPDKPNHLFRINTTSYIEEYATELLESADEIEKTSAANGITIRDFKSSINKTKAFILGFFSNNNQPTFLYTAKKSEIEDQILELTLQLQKFCYDQIGMVKSATPVAFSQKDLQTFQVDPREISINPEIMGCHAYALLRVGETQARDLIFKGTGCVEVLSNLFSFLEKWGWNPVDEPREGDLAVYLDGDNKPTHVGVCKKGGFVSSKPGFFSEHSYLHKFFDLSALYGKKVVFFRKTNPLEKAEVRRPEFPIALNQEHSSLTAGSTINSDDAELIALADELIAEWNAKSS